MMGRVFKTTLTNEFHRDIGAFRSGVSLFRIVYLITLNVAIIIPDLTRFYVLNIFRELLPHRFTEFFYQHRLLQDFMWRNL